MSDLAKNSLVPSWRLAIACISCATLGICFIQRSNISISVLCMLESNFTTTSSTKTVSWSETQIGTIFGAYYIGYAISQIPGGLMSIVFGPNFVILGSVVGGSVLTLLSPIFAKHSVGWLVADRVAIGAFAGVLWSNLLQLAQKWFPGQERGFLISVVNLGAPLGVVLANPISAELCIAGGRWEWSFYLAGILGLGLAGIWAISVRSDPRNHRFIARTELDFIESNTTSPGPKSLKKIPFLKILGNLHCWGFFISHSMMAFVFHAFALYLWILLKSQVTNDLRKLCYSIALYWLAYLIMTPVSGFVADLLIKKRRLSRTNTRRLFVCIACLIPALMTLVLGFVELKDFWTIVIIFTAMYASMAFNCGGGIMLTANDMAPEFPSVLWGISNTFATAAGIAASKMIGSLREQSTQSAWRIAMFTCSGANLLAPLVFCLFVSGNPLPELASA